MTGGLARKLSRRLLASSRSACWVAFLLGAGELRAQEPPDRWLTNAPSVAYPEALRALPGVPAADVGELAGGAARRGFQVLWTGAVAAATSNAVPRLHLSWGESDVWTARDWRSQAMQRDSTGSGWRAWVPVPSVELTAAYAVVFGAAGSEAITPLREFDPRAAGLGEATFPFRGLVEGFEEGIDGWEIASGGARTNSLTWSTQALTGQHALRLEVPPGKGSVTVGTVRLRGWMLREYDAVALRIALRTEAGEGRVAVALHSHARRPDLATHPAPGELPLENRWVRLEIPLTAFVQLRAAAVDGLTIQFLAEPGRALLLDDVELVLR